MSAVSKWEKAAAVAERAAARRKDDPKCSECGRPMCAGQHVAHISCRPTRDVFDTLPGDRSGDRSCFECWAELMRTGHLPDHANHERTMT